MATRYDILPPAQRRMLPMLAPLRHLGFVLYGGTAIALRLGHRTSVDFDFFTDHTLDRGAATQAIPLLASATILQDEKDAWTVSARADDSSEAVKLSLFANLGFGRVGEPNPTDQEDVLVASLDDLLGHKLKVLLQRVEAKDYRDIAALLRSGLTLERGLGAAMALFPNFPPCEAVKALVYFKPSELDGLPATDRQTLAAHVDCVGKAVALDILSKQLAV